MRLKLHWQILIALGLAVPAGLAAGQEAALFGITFYQLFDFVGTLFLNALKMLIVPLVVAAIITGVAGVGGAKGLGRLGSRTVIYYFSTSLLAILVGLVLVNLFAPGVVNGDPGEVFGFSADTSEIEARVAGRGMGDVADVFLRMVPVNVVAAAADGQMLGLIFFSLLFGYFMTRIQQDYADAQYNFWQGIFQTMMAITDWVMKFAPVGVFALVAKVVATTGLEAVGPLVAFFFTVLGALAFHFLVTMPLLLLFVARVNPLRHYQAMAPALLTAFSTASSAATLPLTMECVEKNAGVSNRTSSVVLPLGSTVNMDGTALYECVAAIFIAQAYGLDLSFAQQFTVVTLALLTSIGVAGIPAASLVAITIILAAIGLPAEGIGLILAVDRILDMTRTAVNTFGDSCGAVIIGRLEGEKGILQGESDKPRRTEAAVEVG
ncbi:dicarboxylate/amino acid:cation symporter [Thiohalomonas denitrificans]|uniref:Na+/H+-dicarboxylate symporter n=1 Tax=Thiohalomonas denitrificans TaxID=415747 RepID=A0A1G5QPC6_9GAMM|nr:dicarboxylate/amino acid:cation symporter [Thiohalomonas denitrificans]SCZ63602.1 Na+/H+-dicarboxylate symporter [Thiohalomonas denitrificans]